VPVSWKQNYSKNLFPFFLQTPEPLDESHKVIRRLLQEFVENPTERQLEFPQGISQKERAFLEAESNKLNLKFAMKPLMKGESICTVFK
jgi:hypothetical protein